MNDKADFDEFFKKVGSEHVPHRFRVCNRVQSHPGLQPWTCEALVTSEPSMNTIECVQCGMGMVICDCECEPPGCTDICVAGNEFCRHQQEPEDDS